MAPREAAAAAAAAVACTGRKEVLLDLPREKPLWEAPARRPLLPPRGEPWGAKALVEALLGGRAGECTALCLVKLALEGMEA